MAEICSYLDGKCKYGISMKVFLSVSVDLRKFSLMGCSLQVLKK